MIGIGIPFAFISLIMRAVALASPIEIPSIRPSAFAFGLALSVPVQEIKLVLHIATPPVPASVYVEHVFVQHLHEFASAVHAGLYGPDAAVQVSEESVHTRARLSNGALVVLEYDTAAVSKRKVPVL